MNTHPDGQQFCANIVEMITNPTAGCNGTDEVEATQEFQPSDLIGRTLLLELQPDGQHDLIGCTDGQIAILCILLRRSLTQQVAAMGRVLTPRMGEWGTIESLAAIAAEN